MSRAHDPQDRLGAAAVKPHREYGYVIIRQEVPAELVAQLLPRADEILKGHVPALGVRYFGAGSNRGPDDPGRRNRQVLVGSAPPCIVDLYRKETKEE